jgi:hypothetical protein
VPVRINPFSPSRPLPDAGLFAGRADELRRGYQFVLQAAAGNPRHMLITGPRGIGKSTLALSIVGMSRVETQYLGLLDVDTDQAARPLLVAPYIAQVGQGTEEIAATWTARLRRATSASLGVQIDEAEVNVLLARLKVRRATQEGTVASRLVGILSDIVRDAQPFADGVILYADELDQISDQSDVAPFLKVLSEQLAHEGLRNVALLIVGQNDLAESLAKAHPSATRLFEQIHLAPLADNDVKDLVETALIGTDTRLDDDAMQTLVTGAGGFPSAVHLIAHEAFTIVGSRPATLDEGSEVRVISANDVKLAIEQVTERGELVPPG